MNQETAQRVMTALDCQGWWDGRSPYMSGMCLGMAISYLQGDRMAKWADIPEMHEAQRVIRRLFPGRVRERTGAGREVADFNDHPDTTEEDVRLVVKHLGEES